MDHISPDSAVSTNNSLALEVFCFIPCPCKYIRPIILLPKTLFLFDSSAHFNNASL